MSAKTRRVSVKVLQQRGQAALVEYLDPAGTLHRVTIPASEIHDNEVAGVTLAMGIEYGLPWEELLTLRVTPALVARELRRRGIWTQLDLRSRPDIALAALQAAYGIDLAALRIAAERYAKEAP